MAAKDIFLKVLAFLGFINFVLYLADVSNLLDIGSIITTFVSLGLIVVAISILPFVNSGSSSVKWFIITALVVAMLYSVQFDVMTWHVVIGLGLITNITNLFSSSPTNISFLPFLFFNFLGFIALVSGIIGLGSGE
jgi:hypothetical protein